MQGNPFHGPGARFRWAAQSTVIMDSQHASKGRSLSFEDVQYDQKIIKLLTEADWIVREIAMPLT
jgi:hypothetical protein